jgi:hypothetical protein
MPSVPHPIRAFPGELRPSNEDFSGQLKDHVAAPPQRKRIFRRTILAMIGLASLRKVNFVKTNGARKHRALNRVKVMSSAKTITTLASVAAVACGLFAFSWVSLALLGF